MRARRPMIRVFKPGRVVERAEGEGLRHIGRVLRVGGHDVKLGGARAGGAQATCRRPMRLTVLLARYSVSLSPGACRVQLSALGVFGSACLQEYCGRIQPSVMLVPMLLCSLKHGAILACVCSLFREGHSWRHLWRSAPSAR